MRLPLLAAAGLLLVALAAMIMTVAGFHPGVVYVGATHQRVSALPTATPSPLPSSPFAVYSAPPSTPTPAPTAAAAVTAATPKPPAPAPPPHQEQQPRPKHHD